MPLSFEDVQKILSIVEESDCEEVRLEFGDLKLHLRKHADEPDRRGEWRVEQTAGASGKHLDGARASDTVGSRGASVEAVPEGLVAVTAPMVGTFYRSPAPGEAPFVEPGTTVAADDTVCLVEVMKLFNSVKAGVAGTVERVLVENGALVEYGQPLVYIRKAA